MMKFYLKYLFAIVIVLCSSCMSSKKAVYFDDIPDSVIDAPPADLESEIKPNDILSITVSSLNPDASKVFNSPNVPVIPNYSQNTATTTTATGYLVSLEGYIQFPILGNIKAAGLTKKQLKDHITKTLLDKKLLVDPIVDIRYLNYRISVLGEVANPSVVTVPSEKISLLEALSLAGDLTIYARRDNVLLVRDEDGKRITKRIDLNSRSLFTSPYYFLKANDIIYVEANNSKIASTRKVYLWLPVVFSFLSFAIIVVDRYDRY
jgi:polysaccharide export outer membrane protein